MLNAEQQRELLERSKQTLKDNEFYFKDKRLILPSISFIEYKGVWNWDSAFIALAVSEWDIDLALSQIDMFFDNMNDIGMTLDAFLVDGRIYSSISKPPVFAWVIYEIVNRYQRYDLVDKYYDKLVKNESFWVKYRNEDGLFHYDAFSKGDIYKFDEKNESGWDNSVRWDDGAHNFYAIDLNCYMILFYRTLAYFADYKGLDGNLWREKSEKLKTLINDRLWNDEEQAYTDFDYEKGKFSSILTPASFMPLFVGIAPKDRAEKMKELADSPCFYPLMPSVSYDNPKYEPRTFWRGPTWLNIAYFAVKGLKNYDYDELAEKYRENLLNMCYEEKGSIYEYYDSQTGEGLNAKSFSWSAVFIIEFLKWF